MVAGRRNNKQQATSYKLQAKEADRASWVTPSGLLLVACCLLLLFYAAFLRVRAAAALLAVRFIPVFPLVRTTFSAAW
jgi:hypothetical protein